MTTPDGLDPHLQHPTRLTVAAFLSGCAEAEFGAVRDYAGLSDASVSRIATALAEAGYVRVRKGYAGRRPRTWLSLTAEGRLALAAHLEGLRALAYSARRAGAVRGKA
ncbi:MULTISPECIES: transcriptional regulator [Streptomyces]|uniref:Transcriptional regulator n=1 Tax=Streptomyces evansiae TaxID=3075535 RepID=A0ABU2QVB1_9ACTN|nr:MULTISPECIES: transcriptional regulator [unclassified Streptomyces]MDT0408392.1 transcriptional regulator [Streptomyces sp. DSM 41979]MYQ58285.1 transcriptional regulator [Streptomyces sp. SID4926]SCE44492.1 transcriptional regulator [Streptomyces sp. DfronAA-171]